MGLTDKAILRSVLYGDIFDFSLTKDEIFRYLISSQPLPQNSVRYSTEKLIKQNILVETDGYITLPRRQRLALDRKRNKDLCKEKYEIAQKAAGILQSIPSLLFVGISGSVAVNNTKLDDDIDLFVISEGDSMWMTRLLALFYLSKHGMRRTRGNFHEKNTICMNMFLSEQELVFPKSRQDIYTAHEIVQLRPLFSRNNTFERFIKKNHWTSYYLPHALSVFDDTELPASSKRGIWYTKPMLQFVEFMQRIYMHPHKTTETVTETLFAFHPQDYRQKVLNQYKSKLQQYHLSEI